MLEESRCTEMTSRPLHEQELELVQALVGASFNEPKPEIQANARVTQMDDGGMGSIRFTYSDPQPMARGISEALYTDSDGVLLSINLNVDSKGRLFELDFWKVDFSPLKRYPRPGDLLFTS